MLGSDFEVFMWKDGEFVPETFLGLPDKQEAPVTLEDERGVAGFLHRDNLMLEMGVIAAPTYRQLADNVSRALIATQAWLEDKAPGVEISDHTTAWFYDDQLKHPNAMELGCDIDFVSDFDKMNSVERQRMEANDLGEHRFAGGHIHVSYDTGMFPAWLGAVVCELFVGLPAVQYLDRDRAMYYGNSTLHRPTQYPDGSAGVEYRALDSGWVHDPQTRLMVALGAARAEKVLNSKDNDLMAQLHRVAAESRCYMGMLCDIEDADDIHDEAVEIMTAIIGDVDD